MSTIIGEKIKRIRKFRGLTMQELGLAIGFDEKSANVRIAQYESGTRTPKQELIEKIAEILDVNPLFISNDDILGAGDIMLLLLELDEHYPISIQDCKNADGNSRKAVCFDSILMSGFLAEWQKRKKDLADGKISKVEYTEWKLNFPKTSDDCGKRPPEKEWRDLTTTETKE